MQVIKNWRERKKLIKKIYEIKKCNSQIKQENDDLRKKIKDMEKTN